MSGRQKVSEFLARAGVETEMREFGESTGTSSQAAEVLGCTLAEIAKSVVFIGGATAVVVLSGDRRVDAEKLGKLVGGPVGVATAEKVRKNTGYPIGGVPPFPHDRGVRVFPDTSLTRFERVWAAAGAPNAVFNIRTHDLVRLVGAGPDSLSI